MTVQVDNVVPRRARGNSTYVIAGSGFDALIANNDVIVAGSSGNVVAASPTSVSFTLPFLFSFGIVRGVFAPCQVVNLVTGERCNFWIRVKETIAEVAARTLLNAVPGPAEVLGPDEEVSRVMEAKDSERLSTLLEAFLDDVAAGNVLGGTGAGLASPGGTAAQGAVLVADPADSTGMRWDGAQSHALPFGGSVGVGATLLVGDGDQAAVAAGDTEQWAAVDGTLDLIHLLVQSGGPTLDRVRVLVNGSAVYDSGTGLGIGALGLFSANPAAAVVAGNRVEVEATALGGVVSVVGACELQVT